MQPSLYLATLDKKLLTVQHRYTEEELSGLTVRHNMTEEQLKQEIQKQLYQQFINGVALNIPTIVQVENGNVTFSISGYCLSDRQMLETLLEVADMDSDMREKMIAKIKPILGM